MEPKQKQHPVGDVTGDGSKVRCCKEQYCTGTWHVKSTNQGKLEVVKQEMPRVNINFSLFSITGRGIDLDYCDIEWFALEMNRDHSVVFEIVSKYCILDSFL